MAWRLRLDQTPTALSGLTTWDQQQAKAKFSEVVRRARPEGPQVVTTRSTNAVVVLSADDDLALRKRPPLTFGDLLFPCDGFAPVQAGMPAIYKPFGI